MGTASRTTYRIIPSSALPNPGAGRPVPFAWPPRKLPPRWTLTRSSCSSSTRSATCSPGTPPPPSAATSPGSSSRAPTSGDPRGELRLVSEMVEALGLGQSPPFGGLHDVRLVVRRAAIGTMLTAEQLLEVGRNARPAPGPCTATGCGSAEHLTGLIELLAGIEDLGAVAKTIGGCIDGRGPRPRHGQPRPRRRPPEALRPGREGEGGDPPAAPRPGAAPHPELPERHRQRRPLRAAGGGQPPAQGARRRPPRQRHRRDGVRRAGRRSPASAPSGST